MTILFIIALAVVPAVTGRAALRLLKKEKSPAVWESYIIGVLLCILTGEALHVGTVFLHWPFHRFSLIYGSLLVVLFVLALFINATAYWREKKTGTGRRERNRPAEKKPGPWAAAFFILVLFQCIFHIVMHKPDMQYDVSLEQVTTMLSTDTVYQINPMTGQPFETGMPMRLKVLALPSIYAALSDWFRLDAQTVVYNWIPVFVLILSYMTLFGWAGYLYPQKTGRQERFLFFAALLLQFGNYAVMMLGYGLFHMGYRGETFCAGILYPYLLLQCLQKKKLAALLCLIAEVGLVWTWYGLGAGLLICLVSACLFLLPKAIKGRRKAA